MVVVVVKEGPAELRHSAGTAHEATGLLIYFNYKLRSETVEEF
jgi:hypothetical protein